MEAITVLFSVALLFLFVSAPIFVERWLKIGIDYCKAELPYQLMDPADVPKFFVVARGVMNLTR
jgi:hypothetical protein